MPVVVVVMVVAKATSCLACILCEEALHKYAITRQRTDRYFWMTGCDEVGLKLRLFCASGDILRQIRVG